jgi:hypothetical protein
MSYNDMGFSMNMTGATFMLLAQNQIQEATVGERWLLGTVWVYAGANVNYVSSSTTKAPCPG